MAQSRSPGARKGAARKVPAPTPRPVTKKTAAPKKAAARPVPPTTKKKAVAKTVATKSAVTKSTTGKSPAAKKAVPASPFPAKWLEAQHAALIEERATYLGQAESLRAEADALVADFEPGDVQFDEESGEGDTLAIERERDLALSAQARHAVDEIDHALAKMEAGTYGLCEVSGEPIPKERLEAIPWARERVEYKIGGISRR